MQGSKKVAFFRVLEYMHTKVKTVAFFRVLYCKSKDCNGYLSYIPDVYIQFAPRGGSNHCRKPYFYFFWGGPEKEIFIVYTYLI